MILATTVATLVLALGGAALAAPGAAVETPTAGERRALLELFAAETALARAGAAEERLTAAAADSRLREAAARGHVALVRRSLAGTQARASTTLRALYIEGDRGDPIAILLGADSLDAALDGLDGLAHIARSHERLAAELAATERRLLRTLARARDERRRAERASADARVAVRRLTAAVTERAETARRLRSAARRDAARAALLEQTAQAAARRAIADDRAPAAPAPPAPAPTESASSGPVTAPPGGTRTLVVDAVAYHLPGRTASGLPVGPGVIAVDPTVIPLGTRVFVPGYGPAIAADTGTAIKGNIIDLWMPSTAAARAWGRRTVTITIYG